VFVERMRATQNSPSHEHNTESSHIYLPMKYITYLRWTLNQVHYSEWMLCAVNDYPNEKNATLIQRLLQKKKEECFRNSSMQTVREIQ
jgi:hypothetical protein